jgi:riboflavin transporter 2
MTFVFVCLFAVSSWIDINGVWVEVPLLVNELPEGWNLPSYLVVIIQVANVGPLVYTVARKVAPDRVHEPPVVYLIICVGAVACLLLAFLWQRTTFIGGSEHSTALLTLCAFLSLVDCTSSVVYLPYMAAFRAQYLTSFYVGEGLSGLLPALVGLAQGVGRDPVCLNESTWTSVDNSTTERTFNVVPYYDPPLFSVGVFFGILFGLVCLSGISFSVVHFHPRCRREKISNPSPPSSSAASTTVGENVDGGGDTKVGSPSELQQVLDISMAYTADTTRHAGDDSKTDGIVTSFRGIIMEQPLGTVQKGSKTYELKEASRETKGKSSQRAGVRFVVLLLIVGWTNALTNGVLPSLQSYSCLPYGNLAYNLSVRLSVAANPLACFFALFVLSRSVVTLAVLTGLGTVLAGYQVALAALSPSPPLQDSDAGVALAIVTFVLLTAFFSYVKVCAAVQFNTISGPSGLLWCGCSTQIGSLIGAVVTFLLVNVFTLFTSAYPCT